MEIKNAKLIKICDAQEGVNKKGDAWRKVTAVVETTDHYPKTIALTCFNSVCETVTAFTPGALLNVTFDVESRCWLNPQTNLERWFTEATARIIVHAVVSTPQGNSFDQPIPKINEPNPQQYFGGPVPKGPAPKDDLPF